MSSFQLSGLSHEPFVSLFLLSDEALRQRGILRQTASADFGFPCRISLQDARAGDELLLLPFEHQPGDSPYRSTGPIYVRRGARRAVLPAGVVPPYVGQRLMSLRAYDAAHMMIHADVLEGSTMAQALERLFDNPQVAYAHLHNAKRGCFSCLAERAAN